ncbi:endospore germination permease [Sporomusa sp. GT1]|uniref:GerAB/ArcD/ProY family transporter n=1 Tax=Sporomusa sp. GT1 TaxID=1534747 RepID=UPI0016662003|nr:endospore germination permease [Sporomusa sp. GT1]
MQTESISARNISCLLILSILCGTVISGSTTVGQDFLIAVFFAGMLFLPLIYIYSRICSLFPGKNLYDIIQVLFGKKLSFMLILLMSCYALIVSALVLRNFVEFTVVIALQNTPRIPLMIVLAVVAAYLAQSGPRILGRWSLIICVLIIGNVVFTILLALDTISIANLQPMLNHSPQDIAANAFIFGSIAFGETVLAMTIFGSLKRGESPYKAYFAGIIGGIFVLIFILMRNLLILGPEMIQIVKFASYMAARIIHFGSFFERIESLISFNLILLGLTKIALCLTATSLGIAKLLKIENFTKLSLPVCHLVLALCSLIFKNMFEMFDFAKIYGFLAVPFQLLIPLVIWLTAEIKIRKKQSV